MIRKSEKLKEKCINIFGDIVDECYIEVWQRNKEHKYSVIMLEKIFNDIEISLTNSCDNQVNFDSESLIIKFNNGHYIEFTSSEWASFEKININDHEEFKE